MSDVKIDDIVKQGYCLGCGLCVSVLGKDKIRIIENSEGFLVPEELNSQKTTYNRDLCPGITVRQTEKKKASQRYTGRTNILKLAMLWSLI